MNKKEFAALTPEQVAALTGKDLEGYNKYILEQNGGTSSEPSTKEPAPKKAAAPAAPKVDPAALAKEYFKNHPDSPFDAILVTSDGVIYGDTPRGVNAANNYVRENKAGDVKISKHSKF